MEMKMWQCENKIENEGESKNEDGSKNGKLVSIQK